MVAQSGIRTVTHGVCSSLAPLGIDIPSHSATTPCCSLVYFPLTLPDYCIFSASGYISGSDVQNGAIHGSAPSLTGSAPSRLAIHRSLLYQVNVAI